MIYEKSVISLRWIVLLLLLTTAKTSLWGSILLIWWNTTDRFWLATYAVIVQRCFVNDFLFYYVPFLEHKF